MDVLEIYSSVCQCSQSKNNLIFSIPFSSKVGDTIELQAHATGEIEILTLLVFGTNGLIYSEEFEDAAGKDIYNFKIQLTEEMKPEIRGLVFYIRPSDGVMVYDEFSLSLGFSIDNFVS